MRPDGGWVTDGGLETDLMFHRGVDLPEFAAFPLVDEAGTAAILAEYYAEYAAIARAAGAGLLLETPTWRANPDWGGRIGYDRPALDRVNRRAVELVREIAGVADVERVRLAGVVGPRGDGYRALAGSAEEAAEYHSPQIVALAAEGVDLVHAMTLGAPFEAIGIVEAARAAGVPVRISFTVETDGRLPDGTALPDAIGRVDAAAAPDSYGVNCAHPLHLQPALDGRPWQARLESYRPNASTLSHEELDAMAEVDTGDPDLLARATRDVLAALPAVTVVGGCCGTDATHVARLWNVAPPR